MPVRNSIAALRDEFAAYRQDLHRHPQTAYEEEYISGFVKSKLEEWGISYKDGYAGTGIVATIHGLGNSTGRAIGLRADMDALDIEEKTGLDYASEIPGKMHACGHDGHTAILLATAKYLNETRHFDGQAHLIFQPAEEGGRGANKMVDEGLFRDFPMDRVFAIHNFPWLPVGQGGVREGTITSAVVEFQMEIAGLGGHGAMPDKCIDPVIIATQIVSAYQSLIAREIDPLEMAVLSVTNLNAGTGAFSIIPETASLKGTVRYYNDEVGAYIEKRMEEIARTLCKAMRGELRRFDYIRDNYPTVNDSDAARFAGGVMQEIMGSDNVDTDIAPWVAGEDFSAMTAEVPGAYVFIGQGDPKNPGSHHNKGLHHPEYDFNDDIIPLATEYFTALVEKDMPLRDVRS